MANACGRGHPGGQRRVRLARRWRSISPTDALIAAAAVEMWAILVIDNLEDYPLPEAQLWRLGS